MSTELHSTRYGLEQADALEPVVRRMLGQTPITDIHTHLYAPAFGELLEWGIDRLLTYHYLIAEVMRVSHITPEAFFKLSVPQQADLIWKELFLERTPLSEACRGVLTVLNRLGLDTSERDLEAYRAYFASQDPSTHIDNVFEAAGVQSVTMTNDPFDSVERPVWEQRYEGDPRFLAALRIDPLLNAWDESHRQLEAWGYGASRDLGPDSCKEVRRFLDSWLTRMDAQYMAVSLPPDFIYPDDSPRSTVLSECILPVAREHGVPFAMMIGVTRQVNPALRSAGDGVGKADMRPVHRLCEQFPDNKFMVTMLARENQHELCVAARKFPNLFVFGCWWFLNNPALIEEITRMRFELLGTSFLPQHSDCRVLEQVLYKWDHSREIIAKVLTDKYQDLVKTGWTLTEDEIARDAERFLGGSFWEFKQRP